MVCRFRFALVSSFVLLLTLVLSSIVYAAPTVSLDPIEAYEGQTVTIDLSVNNFMEVPSNHVRIEPLSAEVVGMYDFISWVETFDTSFADWTNGPLPDNAVGIFRFDAKLSTVSDDKEVVWTADIIDIDGTTTEQALTFTILNDATPPEISNENPSDGDVLLGGNNAQKVSIDAIDDESGIDDVTFMYDNCESSTNSVVLKQEPGTDTFLGVIDLSNCHEGDTLSYGFEANNNAGESSVYLGEVIFDETAPDVELIFPSPDDIIGKTSIFTFNVEDNYDDELECEIFVDGVSIEDGTFDEGNNDVDVDLSSFSDGNHEWQVGCTDDVGLTEIEQGNFVLDNIPPVITLISPDEGLISDTIIDIQVTDNNGIDSIDYSIPLDTSTWSEGVNTLVVTATDLAGNIAEEEFTFTLDRTAPTIVLNSPNHLRDVDYHVDFSFTPSDVYDALLDCQVKVDVFGESAISEYPSGASAIVSMILGLDKYDWHVECVDDAGNLGKSEIRTIYSVDLTGPDISGDKEFVVRSISNEFRVTVTDVSDIVSVQAYLFDDGPLNLVLDSGNDYVLSYTPDVSTPLGAYSIRYVATDINGFSTEFVDEFDLIIGYILELDLKKKGKDVTVDVTIKHDDGSQIDENEVTLNYPGGTTLLSLVNGEATHVVEDIGDGTHDFELVFEADNGYTYRKSDNIKVGKDGGSSGGDTPSSGGGTRSGQSQGIGGFYSGDLSSVTRGGASSGGQPSTIQQTGSDGQSGSVTVPQSPQPRTPQPVGEATGLFGMTKILSNWWIILLLAGLVVGLGYYAKKKTGKKSISSNNGNNNKNNIFR